MNLGPAHPVLTGIRVHQSHCVCCCIWTDGWINLQIPGQPVVSWMHRLFVRQRKANVKVTMTRWKTQELSVNKKEGHSETWSMAAASQTTPWKYAENLNNHEIFPAGRPITGHILMENCYSDGFCFCKDGKKCKIQWKCCNQGCFLFLWKQT